MCVRMRVHMRVRLCAWMCACVWASVLACVAVRPRARARVCVCVCVCVCVTGDDAMQFIAWRRSLTSCPRKWCHYSQYSQYYKGYRVEWGGACVCARKQWAYVFRCFSVSVQNLWKKPRSEVPRIVLLQGAVKILPRKINLELRIPVFQRLHCN